MRYNKVRKMDIANGEGVRVSVFFQGCAFHCKNCFNPETWDFKCGKEYTDEVQQKILDLCDNDYIAGLSILGGEPMHPTNIKGTTALAKAFKERFPNKNIWAWSGFTYEDYVSKQDVINYIDVLVDGQYKDELFDPRLKFRGSSNQRLIDVKKSLKNKKVVLYELESDE
jgi:anaerobic ribonucleoside-triphosphate reductase activating protein